MQHEREPWDNFDISPDFTERLMQRLNEEPVPALPLWRRLDAWESRLEGFPALRLALRLVALLAGAANITGLYLFLIGA